MANTEQDVEILKKDFQNMKSDISELSSAVKELITDEARKAEKKVEHEIEQHPMASVGVALGLGFIIGMLIDRKLH